MTKEVCYKALNQLQAYASKNGGKFEQEYEILSKLIKQHFDNPPLKPEELEAGMWVWDNKSKKYHFIREIHRTIDKILFIRASRSSSKIEPYYVDVEENRFYRKQVKE